MKSQMDDRENSQRNAHVAQLLQNAHIPKRYLAPARRDNKAWTSKLDQLQAKIGTGMLIGLLGTRGEGKTMLAIELIKAACQSGKSGIYVTAMEVFMAIKAGYNTGTDEGHVLMPFKIAAVLVIDEAQERGATPWEDRLLTHLVDNRYANMRDTIIVSNQKPADFGASMGSSIMSRMQETGGIVACDWPSFRVSQ
ncbi:MAG: ATP-binding protein [Verrucomicrobia bacterium]|nr:ATP-binding protein [Verrucomicrobiota bacterium]MBU4247488.1 ATP-binding protein [Verrucomicrobiota bacterium]MBU4292319.1 ATP-binding protein [Verrucomicrobiota bacterium]MBU4497087.1 ATP-binding protein [Verrucomicrobiota bacterium]MCG2678573.1 ATP-binding protein [Kiritimatiellia bacterium]